MVTFLTPLVIDPIRINMTKGSIGHAFTVRIRTENLNQDGFYPFVLHEISVLIEPSFGHLCYLLTDVPPQPNSPPDNVFTFGRVTICTSYLISSFSPPPKKTLHDVAAASSSPRRRRPVLRFPLSSRRVYNKELLPSCFQFK